MKFLSLASCLRFGEKEGNAIIEHCETDRKTRKYTAEELKNMRTEFSAMVRELEAKLEGVNDE